MTTPNHTPANHRPGFVQLKPFRKDPLAPRAPELQKNGNADVFARRPDLAPRAVTPSVSLSSMPGDQVTANSWLNSAGRAGLPNNQIRKIADKPAIYLSDDAGAENIHSAGLHIDRQLNLPAFPVNGEASIEIAEHIKTACRLLAQDLTQNHDSDTGILVHCADGISSSAAAVAATLAYFNQMSFRQAVESIVILGSNVNIPEKLAGIVCQSFEDRVIPLE